MYRSKLDPDGLLQIPFDPVRKYNGAVSMSDWKEYPYKLKTIDLVKSVEPRLSVQQTAGLLLIARGDAEEAIRQVALSSEGVWSDFEARYNDERRAFLAAKKQYILDETSKMAQRLAATEKKRKDAEEVVEMKRLASLQKVKRYDNGDKYDGAVVVKSGNVIPHGEGTLWVPECYAKGELPASIKTYKKYSGRWVDGKMHGKGTVYWSNGDSWEGQFVQNDLQGKGIFRSVAPDGTIVVEEGRYYQHSRHVAWFKDLTHGVHIEILPQKVGSNPMSSNLQRDETTLDRGETYMIRNYNPDRDLHLIEKCCVARPSKWVCLSNLPFRMTPHRRRPMTDLIN